MNMLRMEEADYIDTHEFLKDEESNSPSPTPDENEDGNGNGKNGNQEDMSIASVLCGLTG